MKLGSTAMLPLCFGLGLTTAVTVEALPVTFQVNLAVQTTLGAFTPGTDAVEVHGSFNNWGPGTALAPGDSDPSIYEGAIDVSAASGSQVQYKFVINQTGSLFWEGNVGPGGPNGNRTLTLVAGSQELPVVYFNNLTNNPGAGISVTFLVSLAVLTARGTFDPSTGTVDVRGPFNNWGSPSGFILTNSPANPTLFAGTIGVATASPGNSVPYKFTMNGTWEMGDNRSFILASSAQTLPVDYFDRVSDFGPITIETTPFIVTLSWTPGVLIRLQSTTSVTNGVWDDVPNTLGQASAVLVNDTFVAGAMFFRLTGP